MTRHFFTFLVRVYMNFNLKITLLTVTLCASGILHSSEDQPCIPAASTDLQETIIALKAALHAKDIKIRELQQKINNPTCSHRNRYPSEYCNKKASLLCHDHAVTYGSYMLGNAPCTELIQGGYCGQPTLEQPKCHKHQKTRG
jgi:hypothetical protein